MKLTKAERRYHQAINDFWHAVSIGSIHLAYAEHGKVEEMQRTNPTAAWSKEKPFQALTDMAKTNMLIPAIPRCYSTQPEKNSHKECDACGVQYRSGSRIPLCLGHKVVTV